MADKVIDPVCGMWIDPENAIASEEYEGQTFYFCSAGCNAAFHKDPRRYVHASKTEGQ